MKKLFVFNFNSRETVVTSMCGGPVHRWCGMNQGQGQGQNQGQGDVIQNSTVTRNDVGLHIYEK